MDELAPKAGLPGLEQFTHEVFPAELDEIKARRKRLGEDWEQEGAPMQPVFAQRVQLQEQQALGEEMMQAFEARQEVSMGQKLSWWVQARLRNAFSKAAAPKAEVRPSTSFGLAGLAFSGGGVRSATFNLGVLQALSEADALKRFDYLSTVSGGGYLGSCLSSVLNSKGAAGQATVGTGGEGFPLNFDGGASDSPALKWLRNKSSKYLAPADLFEALRMGLLLTRGFLFNIALFLPYVVFAALAVHFQVGGHLGRLFAATQKPDLGSLFVYSPVALAILAMLVVAWKPAEAAYAWWKEGPRGAWDDFAKALVWAWKPFVLVLAGFAACILLTEGLGALILQYGYLRKFLDAHAGRWLAAPEAGGALAWLKFVAAWTVARAPLWLKPLAGIFVPLAAVWKLSRLGKPWAKKASILALGLVPVLISLILLLELGAGFSLGLWPGIPSAFTQGAASDFLAAVFRGEFCFGVSARGFVMAWLSLILVNALCVLKGVEFPGQGVLRFFISLFGAFGLMLALAWSAKIFKPGLFDVTLAVPASLGETVEALSASGPLHWAAGALSVLAFPMGLLALAVWALLRSPLGKRLPPAAAAVLPKLMGPALLVLLVLGVMAALRQAVPAASQATWGPLDLKIYYSLAAAALLWYAGFQLVDVNGTSLHSLYRDALANAYLFTVDEKGRPAPNTGQKLSKLHDAAAAPAPYHLICAAVNLPSSPSTDLNGRSTDFFTFSKLFVGGPHTGYQDTKAIEAQDPSLNLGTALAVSGAAASPNMGTQTVRVLVPFLAMLNVRLGYWAPNPRRSAFRLRMRALAPRLARVGYAYLLKEMSGFMDDTRLFVNVSDGGHIENLGLYELLRRRCRLIVAGDAEADPNMGFHGLAQALRYASIDLRVELEGLDLEPLRKDSQGMSKRSVAFAKITYGKGTANEEQGYLIYIKSSFTGREGLVPAEYKTEHLEFPHESTGDQFFDEAQFEAYRSLAYHIGKSVFSKGLPPQEDLGKWWEELKKNYEAAHAL